LRFELARTQHPTLINNLNVPEWTVIARPVGEAAQTRETPSQGLQRRVMSLIVVRAAADEMTSVSSVRDAKLAGVPQVQKTIEALISQGLLTDQEVDGAVFDDNRKRRILFPIGADRIDLQLRHARRTLAGKLTGKGADRLAEAIQNLERKKATGQTSHEALYLGEGVTMPTGP
jgi:hypothetical protein